MQTPIWIRGQHLPQQREIADGRRVVHGRLHAKRNEMTEYIDVPAIGRRIQQSPPVVAVSRIGAKRDE